MGDEDLQGFLETVVRVMSAHADAGQSVADPQSLIGALASAEVDSLAIATEDLSNSRTWLAAVITEVARRSPSFGLALAAQYTADRALAAIGVSPAGGATSGMIVGAKGGVVPLVLEPTRVVLVDEAGEGLVAGPGAWQKTDTTARTGLGDAVLADVQAADSATALPSHVGEAALRDWCLFSASAALGTAEALKAASDQYAVERRQFGSPIAGFAGLRALIIEMDLRIATVSSQRGAALGEDSDVADHLRLAAAAGRTAVQTGVDAVQVHGGYGYIEEYPAAGLVRDAVSLQARSVPRRAAVGRLGADTFAHALPGGSE